jgi:hypothetical protein
VENIGRIRRFAPTTNARVRRGESLTRPLLLALFLIPTLLLIPTSLPLVITLSSQYAPPEQAAFDIRAHYPADQSIVVSQGSFRAAQVDLADYPQLYLGLFDAANWTQMVQNRQPRYLILLDRDDVWPEAYAAVAGGYVAITDRVFSRDPRVFPQHSLVRMQILTPLALLTPDQLAPPESGKIAVGDESMGRYFGEGWYRAEEVAGSSVRWTQQNAVIHVALPAKDTTLILEGTPFPADQSVDVIVNGWSIGQYNLEGVWQPVEIFIPASAIAGHPISEIRLNHAKAEIPLGSNRALAAMYRILHLTSIRN